MKKFRENLDPIEFLDYHLKNSEFLSVIKKVNTGIFSKKSLRLLSGTEIERLKSQQNLARDWNQIKVTESFSTANIINNQFLGKTAIGNLSGEIEIDGLTYRSGIINSTLYNVQIGDQTLIKNVQSISYIALLKGAVISNCLAVTHGSDKHFGIGREMELAIETGGRELKIFPEINIDLARIICGQRGNKTLLKKYSALVDEYRNLSESKWSVLDENAAITDTAKVLNFFLGKGGRIDNACVVKNTVILSNLEEPVNISDGAIVKNSIVQWGSKITTGAIAEDSVFTEHSGAEKNGKVINSLIGANSYVAEGEVTASLIGSFVGFHHQALMIAAYWPEGKGNISYGANVGSNHTGKAPDQEIWPGEGTFFGLSCSIKFPADFTNAPYSIIATAVTTLPQKLEYPFSLINTPAHSFEKISPAYNEIYPAWVLSDNIYMVKRNEEKYKARNKAKRIYIKFDIFRPSIVDKMLIARNKLAEISGQSVYTDKDIIGLGKNYLMEPNRKKAVSTYSFFIQYYCLNVMMLDVMANHQNPDGSITDWIKADSSHPYAQHVKNIIVNEVGSWSLQKAGQKIVAIRFQIAENVFLSKKKDDDRGQRIIRDYIEAHGEASQDQFVIKTKKAAEDFKKEMDKFLKTQSSAVSG